VSTHRVGWGLSGIVPGFKAARLLRPVLLTLLTAGSLILASSGPALAGESCPNEAIREEQGSKLSDCRAYELVSPSDKNGAEVITKTDKTHVAPDGNAVTFSSLGGFGSVEGSAFDFEYLSRRTAQPGTSGWSTHGINPLERPVTLPAAIVSGNISTYVDGFASDLSAAVYRTWRPLTDAPNVADVSNLYRIGGLSGGARTVQLMSDAVDPMPIPWFTTFRGFFATLIKPQLAGVSDDLRHVVFESQLDLTGDAPAYSGFCAIAGAGCPVKLYENADGAVRLVGRIPQAPDMACDDVSGPACVAADSSQTALSATNKQYSQLAVSADGRRIFFQAQAGFGAASIYVREDGVRTEQIASNSGFATASADGSRAFFTTSDQLLPADTDGSPDVYMYDLNAPAGSRLTLISANSSSDSGYVEGVVGTNADGHYVYFVCDGQLIAGEPPIGNMGLYVWHDGQLRLIGRLADINVASLNGPGAGWSSPDGALMSRVTPDGRHLLFMNTNDAGLVGHGGYGGSGNGGHQEFYVYDADSGRLACASCNPTGRAATVDAVIGVRVNAGGSTTTSDGPQALSDDGRWAFFNTAEALVPGDTNGRPDAYEYDAQSGTVHLLSSGKSTDPSYVLDASPSGDDVYIATRDRLTGWDVDDRYDLYDARVGGGFPDPPTAAPDCAGDACQGALTVPPSGPSFGSSLLTTSTGNAVPVSKKVSKPASKSQKLKRALKACKSKRSKAKRKKCEVTARKRFGKSARSK